MVYGDVQAETWHKVVQPFTCLLKSEGALAGRQPQCGITDAKSLYDALIKCHPASRQDRRTALELASIIDAMCRGGGLVRWTSHQRMVADMLTKADITKGNGALLHLLRSGTLHIDDEQNELKRREEHAGRSRSRAATRRLLSQEEAEENAEMVFHAFCVARKVSSYLGELLSKPTSRPLSGESDRC